MATSFGYPVSPVGDYTNCQGFKVKNYDYGGKFHLADDWSRSNGESLGRPVYAVADGVVVYIKDIPSEAELCAQCPAPQYPYCDEQGQQLEPGHPWGNTVIVRHDLPYGGSVWSDYVHLNTIEVCGCVDCSPYNCSVVKGQRIGTVGDAGGLYSPHLHSGLHKQFPTLWSPTESCRSAGWPKYSYIEHPYPWELGGVDAENAILDEFYDPTCFIENFNPTDANSVTQCEGRVADWIYVDPCPGVGGGLVGPIITDPVISNITETSVTFTTSVETRELDTTAEFRYGQNGTFGTYADTQTVLANTTPVTITATGAVLCGRTYNVRSYAENTLGADYSNVTTFTTPACTSTDPPPAFSITNVTPPEGCTTTGGWPVLKVSYDGQPDTTGQGGLTHTLYRDGVLVDTREGLPEGGNHVMQDGGTGLYAGTTATYTVVQENVYGQTASSPYPFTLAATCGPVPQAPTAVTLPATGLAEGKATLVVQVTANAPDTFYQFELTDAAGVTSPTPLTPAGEDIVPQYFSAHVSSLACDETYTFRGLAVNAWGPAQGALRTFVASCAPNTPPPPEQTPEAATVALWHMNGPLADPTKPLDAGGSAVCDLTLGGNPTSTIGCGGEFDFDGAYELNGTSDYFDLSGVPTLGTSDTTLMGWARSDRLNDTNHIVRFERHDSTGAPRAGLYINADRTLGATFASAGNADVCELTTSARVEPFVWTHVGVTRASGLHRLYINGLLEAELDCGVNANVVVSAGEQWMGRRFNSVYPEAEFFFRGGLDEWHFLDRALLPSEMESYYFAAGASNTAPTVAITEPNGVDDVADASFTVSWTDADPDNDALVSLSYSSNPTCSGAVAIASYISEDSAIDTYEWDTSQIVSGNYYVLATIDDGLHPPVSVCSQYPVSVSHTGGVPSVLYDVAGSTCFSTAPALGDNGILYARGASICHPTDGGIAAVDPADGATLWDRAIPASCGRFARDGVSVGGNNLVYGSMYQSSGYCSTAGVAAYDAATGSEVFVAGCNAGRSGHTPVLDEALGRVYAGAYYLCSFDSTTGVLAWESELTWDIGWDAHRAMVLGSDNTVHYGITKSENKLGTFSSTGALLWSMNRPTSNGPHMLASRSDGVVFVYYGDIDTLHAKAGSDGTLLWEYPGLNRIVIGGDGTLYGSALQTAEVHALSAGGTGQWTADLGALGAPWAKLEFVTTDGTLFVRGGSTLYALSASDGSVLWSFSASAPLTAAVLVSGGKLFLSDEGMRHYLLDTMLDYAASDWPIALYGNRRHTAKAGDILPLP